MGLAIRVLSRIDVVMQEIRYVVIMYSIALKDWKTSGIRYQ
ncbi:hypothetical protein FOPG_15681 [Fusarium oxysporum f. sp. conglutinans race 2 54008]|uniref:Uncharacterized protein n=1 Tax=Fusarium oxysporum f. sp. conglutinans race 2 54008 TaxID=1089457 RepID=X0I4Q0_FUSOX|nr:hypothetical protein FOPG_15681 [Fusarium oxysporum f. sp. conglutinans race 2 54008]